MDKQLFDISKKKVEVHKNCKYVLVWVGKGNEKLDLNTEFIHRIPSIRSQISIKSVLYDRSIFKFSGKNVIEKGAFDVDTYMKIDILFMSKDAKANISPSMEIKEDNVKAGHGATIGKLDENEVIYLMSRGLTRKSAENEIVKGFLGETQKLNFNKKYLLEFI